MSATSIGASDAVVLSPTLIVLSEDDAIVPVGAIGACARSWRARARGVQVLAMPGLGHGGWILDGDASRRIADGVRALHASRGLPAPLDQFAP